MADENANQSLIDTMPQGQQFGSISEDGVVRASSPSAPTVIDVTPSNTSQGMNAAPFGVDVNAPQYAGSTADNSNYFNLYMNKSVRYINAHFNRSDKQLKQNLLWYDAMKGAAKYEDVKSQVSAMDVASKQELDAAFDTDGLITHNQYVQFGADLVSTIPYMQALSRASIQTGSAAGIALGTAGGTVAALPGFGAGMWLGLTFGGPAGAFQYSAANASGQKYGQIMTALDEHIKSGKITYEKAHEAAVKYATAAGLKTGTIEAAQSFLMVKGFKMGLGSALKTEYGRALIKNGLLRFAANAGLEGFEEATDELGDILIDNLAADELDIDKLKVSNDQMFSRVQMAAAQGAMLGAAHRAGSEAAGNLLGKVVERLTKNSKPGSWGAVLREILEAQKAAEKGDDEPIQERPVSLAQVNKQAQAKDNKSNKYYASISMNVKSEDTAPTPQKSEGLQLANEEFKAARQAEIDAQKRYNQAAAIFHNSKFDTKEELDNAKRLMDRTRKLLDAAKAVTRASKKNVEKWTLYDSIKNSTDGGSDNAKTAAVDARKEHDKAIRLATAKQAEVLADRYEERHDNASNDLFAAKQDAAKLEGSAKTAAHERANRARVERDNMNREKAAAQQLDDIASNKMVPASALDAARKEAKRTGSAVMGITKLAVDLAGRDAADIPKGSLQRVRDVFTGLVENSGLSQGQKNKLKAAIQDAKNIQSIQIALTEFVDTMQNFLESQYKNTAMTALYVAVDGTKPTKTISGGISKHDRSSDAQLVLDVLAALIKPERHKVEDTDAKGNVKVDKKTGEPVMRLETQAEAQTRVVENAKAEYDEAVKNATVDKPVPADIEMRGVLAGLVGDLSKATTDHVKHLTDVINNVSTDSRAERAKEIAKQKEANDNVINQLLTALFGRKSAPQIEDAIKPQNVKYKLDKKGKDAQERSRWQWIKTFGKSQFTWNGLLNILLQKLHPDNRQALKDALGIDKAVVMNGDLHRKYFKSLVRGIAEKLGYKPGDLHKAYRLMAKYSDTKIKIQYTRAGAKSADGTTTLHMPVADAIDLYLMFQDDIPELTDGNGFTRAGDTYVNGQEIPYELTTEGAVKTALQNMDPNGTPLKVAEVLQEWYQVMYREAAAEYKKATGSELTKIEFYSGPISHVVSEYDGTNRSLVDELEHRGNMRNGRTGEPGFVKERVGSNRAVQIKNAFVKAGAYSQQLSHWIAWRETANNLATILGDPRVSTGIKIEYGEEFLSVVNDALEQVAGGGSKPDSAWFRRSSKFFNGLASQALYGNPIQYAKQMTGLISGLVKVRPDFWLSGILNLNKEAADMLMNTPQWEARTDSTVDRFLSAQAEKRPDQAFKQDALENNWILGGKWLLIGDRHTSLRVAYGMYLQTMDSLKAKVESGEITQEAAHQKAIDEAFNLVEETQSSSRADMKNQQSRSKGILERVANLFSSASVIAMEMRITAVRDFFVHRDRKTFVQAARVLAVTSAANASFAMIDALMATMFSDDDDEKEDKWINVGLAAMTGPLGGIIGSFLTPTARYYTTWGLTGKKPPRFPVEHPAYKAGESILDLSTSLYSALANDGMIDGEEAVILADLYAKGIHKFVGKVPLERLTKTLKWLTGVNQMVVPTDQPVIDAGLD